MNTSQWNALKKQPDKAKKVLSTLHMSPAYLKVSWNELDEGDQKKVSKWIARNGSGWFETAISTSTTKGIRNVAPEHHKAAIKKQVLGISRQPMIKEKPVRTVIKWNTTSPKDDITHPKEAVDFAYNYMYDRYHDKSIRQDVFKDINWVKEYGEAVEDGILKDIDRLKDDRYVSNKTDGSEYTQGEREKLIKIKQKALTRFKKERHRVEANLKKKTVGILKTSMKVESEPHSLKLQPLEEARKTVTELEQKRKQWKRDHPFELIQPTKAELRDRHGLTDEEIEKFETDAYGALHPSHGYPGQGFTFRDWWKDWKVSKISEIKNLKSKKSEDEPAVHTTTKEEPSLLRLKINEMINNPSLSEKGRLGLAVRILGINIDTFFNNPNLLTDEQLQAVIDKMRSPTNVPTEQKDIKELSGLMQAGYETTPADLKLKENNKYYSESAEKWFYLIDDRWYVDKPGQMNDSDVDYLYHREKTSDDYNGRLSYFKIGHNSSGFGKGLITWYQAHSAKEALEMLKKAHAGGYPTLIQEKTDKEYELFSLKSSLIIEKAMLKSDQAAHIQALADKNKAWILNSLDTIKYRKNRIKELEKELEGRL